MMLCGRACGLCCSVWGAKADQHVGVQAMCNAAAHSLPCSQAVYHLCLSKDGMCVSALGYVTSGWMDAACGASM
jgi:hypothetical protein